MATRTIIECDSCGSIIYPGDIIGRVGNGILRSVEQDGSLVIEDRGTPFTTCEDCTAEVADGLRAGAEIIRERMEQELAAEESLVFEPESDEAPEEDFELFETMTAMGEEETVNFEAEPNYTKAGSASWSDATCTGQKCCPTCEKADGCCAGFGKPFRGFGVSERQYNRAVENLGLENHLRGGEAGIDSPFASPTDYHVAGRCYRTNDINDQLRAMGALD